jgi:hypothetical protein
MSFAVVCPPMPRLLSRGMARNDSRKALLISAADLICLMTSTNVRRGLQSGEQTALSDAINPVPDLLYPVSFPANQFVTAFSAPPRILMKSSAIFPLTPGSARALCDPQGIPFYSESHPVTHLQTCIICSGYVQISSSDILATETNCGGRANAQSCVDSAMACYYYL